MENFETDLVRATSICDGLFRSYEGEFSRVYPFTTENISGYIDLFDFNNKSLLTVGSSGDQILNAYYNGCRDITLFDINRYAKYYVYLKIAGIISLSYEEFKCFFFKHTSSPFKDNKYMFSKGLFNKIKDNLRYLDFESYLFFDELFSNYEGKKVRDRLFNDDEDRYRVIIGSNNYLRDEDSYNELKRKLKSIYFNFIRGNIFEDDITGMFDNIFLSNLCTTSGLDKLKELLIKLDSCNLKDKGSILLAYLWDIKFDSTKYSKDWIDAYKIPIVKEKLSEFITEAHNITGVKDILFEDNFCNDLVLVYRKK